MLIGHVNSCDLLPVSSVKGLAYSVGNYVLLHRVRKFR